MKRPLLLGSLLLLAFLTGPGQRSCTSTLGQPGRSCAQSTGSTQFQEVYLRAWQILWDNYYRRQPLSRLKRWREAFAGHLSSKSQLRSAIKQMIASLDDDYTYLLSDSDLQARCTDEQAPPVSYSMLASNIGYLKVSSFASSLLVSEARQAMQEMAQADGYVLDLRGNKGGYVKLAQELFAMLGGQGVFAAWHGRCAGGADAEVLRLENSGWRIWHNGSTELSGRAPDLTAGKPLVVLVDRKTRSAAEMLAGALRQNGRALLVGERTFGKGVLQNKYDLDGGLAIKVVTASYSLPDGSDIHNKGIIPDCPVRSIEPPRLASGGRRAQAEQRDDPQLAFATELARRLSGSRFHFGKRTITSSSDANATE